MPDTAPTTVVDEALSDQTERGIKWDDHDRVSQYMDEASARRFLAENPAALPGRVVYRNVRSSKWAVADSTTPDGPHTQWSIGLAGRAHLLGGFDGYAAARAEIRRRKQAGDVYHRTFEATPWADKAEKIGERLSLLSAYVLTNALGYPVPADDETFEACAGCSVEYRKPHLCQDHKLCGFCHPPIESNHHG